MKHEIISSPLTVVLRKGREHYICEKRLRAYMHFERDVKIYKYLTSLLDERSSIDFAEITGLTAHIKGKIGVSGRCDGNCPYKETCRFLRFLEHSQSDKYDFQVCNHNYLLADTL
ncbi:MAG: ATP-dependent DNA helicase, partial [Oscillospiraceae bacterium]|nr:ATP-dependent DNA helicase [Oscillospiraceae bacterium]